MPRKISQNALLERSCQSLDWPFIVDHLRQHASSSLGQHRIEGLTFAPTLKIAQKLQNETSEVRALIDRGERIPMGGLKDVNPQVRAAIKGEVLTAPDFVDIAETLLGCAALRGFFDTRQDLAPTVNDWADAMPDLSPLARRLRDSFDASGELSAAEYPELGRLRKKVQSTHARIKGQLDRILGDPDMETLLQDNFYTVRAERYVIPIKVQHKNIAEGIIHDASGSGQTVFVEPSQVIPLNNELKIAQGELKREERRILMELTARLGRSGKDIQSALKVAAELDFIVARARFSHAIEACQPTLNSVGRVHLRAARHPVLALRGIPVIPNDIDVGITHQAVVISGPNTGGKTVALKTLGLLSLMARCGLHLPTEPGSEMAIFRYILTDIGDTQTIEGDLSTFSGHITAIRDIIESVKEAPVDRYGQVPDALILLDEIAVGTDPTQGAALAQSILLHMVDRGCRVVVTTHYSELKALSTQDARFVSARVEYDGMKPTYRLKYGTPGRSFALDIARGLGLSDAIIAQAESLLSPASLKIEEMVSQLEGQLHGAQTAREAAETAKKEAQRLQAKYQKRLDSVERQLTKLRQEKIAAFEGEVNRAKREIKRVIRDLQNKPSMKAAEKSRESVRMITRKVQEKTPKAPEAADTPRGYPMDWSKSKAGMGVYLVSLKKKGELTQSHSGSGKIEVLVGGLKVKVSAKDIRALDQSMSEPEKNTRSTYQEVVAKAPSAESLDMDMPQNLSLDGEDEMLSAAMPISSNTVDLRGQRVHIGLDTVDRYLDSASLRGEKIVFIIHGHGTGAMRTAVREHLSTSTYVDHFQPGGRGQGDNGVTVVALR